MTYPELKIALDIDDPKTVLSSIGNAYDCLSKSKYYGMYFIVCDDGDVHCFDENGKEHEIDCIPYRCFAHRLFKKIIIPDSVASIGSYAFYGCSELESVTIPKGMMIIGNFTFEKCSKLVSVTIPDSVTNIGHDAFYDCSKLAHVTIGNGVKSIGLRTFGFCSNLRDVTMSSSIEHIDKNAFFGCIDLEKFSSKERL